MKSSGLRAIIDEGQRFPLRIILAALICVSLVGPISGQHIDVVVAQDGSGDFTAISDAIDAMPMYQYERYVILIRAGRYEEKLLIDRNHLTLLGEGRDEVIIHFNLPRSDWEADKDHKGPAVVTITADDVVLKNLTVENTQPGFGPHAFAVYGTGTRTVFLDCSFKSRGGDTVSLWNYKNGQYYHAGCHFEGAVDFVCPRGFCYIENSTFYQHMKTAALWHAAVVDPDQKFVLRNCSFDGVDSFQLGRHHYEAAFYLIDCRFSRNMADRPIYRVTYDDELERNRPFFYGERYYFFNSGKEGEQMEWLSDTLPGAPDFPGVNGVDAKWTFDGKWDPEDCSPLEVKAWEVNAGILFLQLDDNVTVRGNPEITLSNGEVLPFYSGRGRDIIAFKVAGEIQLEEMGPGMTMSKGTIEANTAGICVRAFAEVIDLSGVQNGIEQLVTSKE